MTARGFAGALIPACLVIAAALYSIVIVRRSGDVATPTQWRAVAKSVRAARKPTELIVFAPAWIDPVGREYLGDQMSIAMAARMDSARFSGIWEVSAYGGRSRESEGLRVLSTEHIGALTLRHYEQTPVGITFDFTDKWRDGIPSGALQGRPTLRLEEVGFEPHRCIKVIPLPGQTAHLHFKDVKLGTSIVGYVGLADVFTRRDIRDPGKLIVSVDGEEKTSVLAGVDDGWQRFVVPTTPGKGDVEFSLEAVGPKARDRRICFAAQARK